jgi:hypothetical protein
MASAMTLWNFYFQIFEKAIAKEQVVEFLAHLVQQLAGPDADRVAGMDAGRKLGLKWLRNARS